MKFRIFISSVQAEFREERECLRKLVEKNVFLRRFFTTFVFEHDVVATDRRLDELYLSALAQCDLYIALVGRDYGFADSEGVSATAREYDEATRLGLPRLVFVKSVKESERDPRERKFIDRISPELFRPSFSTADELCEVVMAALAKVLEDRKVSFSDQSFEAQEVADIAELDVMRIRWFVRTAREKRTFPLQEDAPVEEILTSLKMIGDTGRARRVATWCFGRDPQRYAPTSGVKCLSWYGAERVKPMASYKWLQGDVFTMADQALEFVKEKLDLRIGGSQGGSQSVDTFEIDERIVREAINNAIAHRDYASNSSVQVELFKNRLEVYSPGPLNREMNPELLFKRHESHPNNPLLARALYLVKYIEDAGSGTTDMYRICQKTGLSVPRYEYDAQHVRVTIERPVFDEAGRKVAKKVDDVAKNGGEVAKNEDEIAKIEGENVKMAAVNTAEVEELLVAKGVRRDMRRNMISVLMALSKDSKLTITELMALTSLSFGGVRNALSALKSHNLIRREGGDRGGHWEMINY